MESSGGVLNVTKFYLTYQDDIEREFFVTKRGSYQGDPVTPKAAIYYLTRSSQ